MNYFVRSFNVCSHSERNHCFTDTDSIDDYNISPIILRYLNFIYWKVKSYKEGRILSFIISNFNLNLNVISCIQVTDI